jgi:hypothetical protein
MILAPWFYSRFHNDGVSNEVQILDYLIRVNTNEDYIFNVILVFLTTLSLDKTIFFFLFNEIYTSNVYKNNDKNYITILKHGETVISIPYLAIVFVLSLYAFFFIKFYTFVIFYILFHVLLEYKNVWMPYIELVNIVILKYYSDVLEMIKNKFKIN